MRTLLSLCIFVGVLSGASPSGAAERTRHARAATGVLVRGQATLLSGLSYQHTRFDARTAGSSQDEFVFDSSSLVLGPGLGINVGYAPIPRFRVGFQLAGEVRMKVAGRDTIPHTFLDGLVRGTVGPTLGFRLDPLLPLEVELDVGYAGSFLVGGQDAIGAPDNGFPLMEPQHGIGTGVNVFVRPWGARVPFALVAGLHGGWSLTTVGGTTQGVLAGGQLGVAVGL